MTRYIDPRLKVLRHADRLAEIQAGQTPPPVNVEIDLSNRCSLGCAWCHFAYTHTRGPLAGSQKPDGATSGGDLFDVQLLMHIGEQLAAAGVRSSTWTGGGEPTLHPYFDTIIRAWPLPQGIYTHGGHIDNVRARRMKQHMQWVYVSLDECTPDAYMRSKGVDRFDAVLEGVRRLVAADGDATIGVGFLLHAGNYRRVFDMAKLALDDLGADYVQFRPAVRYRMDSQAELDESVGWVAEAMAYLQHPTLADNPAVYGELDRFAQYLDWQGHQYGTCYWSRLQTVITPDGRMWTCVNRREFARSELGDLSKESFIDIWARTQAHQVDGNCRVLCRGHMANQTLNHVMNGLGHQEFI